MKLVRSNLFPTTSTFFNDFFDDDRLWRPSFDGWPDTIPAANVSEDEKAFNLELAVPGMSKDDFKIDVDNGMLSISSEKKTETEEKKENFTRKEFSYGTFTRSFNLPEFVEAGKIKAKYSDGVLRVTLPKKESSKQDTKKAILVS